MGWSNKRKILMCDNVVLKMLILRRRNRPRKRNPTNIIFLERMKFGEFHHLYRQLRTSPNLFHNYCRMLPTTFDYIVNAIKSEIRYKPTNFQRPISVEERLMLTLR
jgi:hypothetical protein